ncbi:MAG: zinc ribbon domain-containing protein [Candidatus Heimdallarchaeota archaeon]|nr:zinc ribbon domain-containing protein [Candidatus Heimdallarchaeota archaeon]MCK4771037.1 zinc ribbon domain-containing protein [Candidatus Heimdallarchaeota archaeon]
MNIDKKWYSISGLTWFIMLTMIIIAYYFLFPERNVFMIVAIVIISLLLAITLLMRRGKTKYTRDVESYLHSHHVSKLKESGYKKSPVVFCKRCKRKIDKDATFCSNCGEEYKPS